MLPGSLRGAATGAALLLCVVAVGCSPAPAPAPSAFPAILGDGCAPLVRQAAANPDLLVDALPAPQRMEPEPIRRPVPPGVLRRDGSASVSITVLVDTAGRPVMSTFKSKASHPWFADGARRAVAKWRFSPATLNGCRVPRNFHWRADAAPRASGKARGKAKAKG